jgi:hypothetical protein
MAIVLSLWEEHYEEPPPSHSTIYDLIKKSDGTGSIADVLKSGRPRSIKTKKMFELIAASWIHSSSML